MPTATAEIIREREVSSPHEVYARSLSTERRLGQVMLSSEIDQTELKLARQEGRDNLSTAVTENLNTDPEFGDYLDIDKPPVKYSVINGQVCRNGEPVVDAIARGTATSREHALKDQRFYIQVARDELDEYNAEAVDAMPVGHGRVAVSMPTIEQLKQHRKFWERLGYRENLVFFQWYAKEADGVSAAVVSMDLDDPEIVREVFAEWGIDIPADESVNSWLRHAITGEMTPEEARQLARDLRDRCYEKRGDNRRRQSVSEYVEANQATVDTIFDIYGPEHAMATASRQKNDMMHDLAQSMLTETGGVIKTEMRRRLEDICNNDTFDDESSLFMYEAIRYAVVEELRKGLSTTPEELVVLTNIPDIANWTEATYITQMELLHQHIAGNIGNGAIAGRTYGGCAFEFDPGDDNRKSPQDAYGGKPQEEDSDELGSLTFICPNGHVNHRKPGKENLLTGCTRKYCMAEVACYN